MTRFVAFSILLALALPGCAAEPDSGHGGVDSLLEADRAFAAAAAERGVDGWVEAFAEDGLQVSGAGLTEGHAAIRALMGPAFADSTFSLSWDPEGARVSADGSLGYTWGRYVSRQGGAVAGTGRYLTVWRWHPDHGWRAEADIGSPAP